MMRMDALIRNITHFKSILYVKGMPLHSLILRLQKALYTELYPYLLQKEITYAHNNFMKIFIDYPIINTGHSLVLPAITEVTMDKFELWTMRKLKEKGILTLLGERPEEAMI